LLGSAPWDWRSSSQQALLTEPSARIFLVQMIVIFFAGGLGLARHDPCLVRERVAHLIQKEQPTADRFLISIFVMVIFAVLVLMGSMLCALGGHPCLASRALRNAPLGVGLAACADDAANVCYRLIPLIR
jgi:hypothetical protein